MDFCHRCRFPRAARLVHLPDGKDGEKRVILLEEIIERNIGQLFLNYDVICADPYRIIRNADLTIDEDEAADLLNEIQKQLKKRKWGELSDLGVQDGMDSRLLKILKKEFHIQGRRCLHCGRSAGILTSS